MKFRTVNAQPLTYYRVLIGDEWYDLVCCINCGSITAVHENIPFQDLDDLTKCCDHPNTWMRYVDARNLIETFVKQWEDKK